MKRLKIGYVTSSISYHGGWDTLSKGIVGGVARYHNVVVLSSKKAENDLVNYEIKNVLSKNHLSFGLKNQIHTAFMCFRYLRDCDVIHALIEPLGPGAAFAAWVLGKPFIITLAGTYCVVPTGNTMRQRIKRIVMRFMYDHAAYIATGSKQNIERIERAVKLGNRWHFVPFGVDPSKFIGIKSYPASKKPFLLTVGGLKPRKGTNYVVRALNLLRDEFPELEYKIAGSYHDTDVFAQELKALVKELKLEDQVHILGRVSDEKLLELYSTCTLFVLAAQTIEGSFEGFPMVYYEAHSLGAPIVSTNGFGSEYVIKNGYNGFLVPQDSVKELADAIRKIVGNPALREEMSRHGKEEAKKHSWDRIGELYIGAYESILTHA